MTNRDLGQHRQLEGGRQLWVRTGQVIDEPCLADHPDPAADVVTQQPVRVGLVVDLVAYPDEPIAAGTRAKLVDRVGDGAVGEVHPPDHPG